MNLTIQLPDEHAAALKAQAEAQGLTIERWLEKLAGQQAQPASVAHLQEANPQEWARRFRAWAETHDPNTPVLPDEAMNRASIYPDRL